jgi:ankyrin repeat protein
VATDTRNIYVAKFIVECQEIPDGETEFQRSITLNRAVIQIYQINVRDIDGKKPMHLAAESGKTGTLHYFLSDINDYRNCNIRGENFLSLSARYGRNDDVKFLL